MFVLKLFTVDEGLLRQPEYQFQAGRAHSMTNGITVYRLNGGFAVVDVLVLELRPISIFVCIS